MHAMNDAQQQLARTCDELVDAMRDATAAWDEDAFDRRAYDLYTAQRAAIPAYDAWCAHELGQRRDPRVRGWRDIPALPIAAYKSLRVSSGLDPVATWRSSGTTMRERSTHELADTALYDTSIDAGVRTALLPDVAAGARAPMPCVQLQPTASDGAHTSSLTHMYDRIRTGPWCTDAGVFVDGGYVVDAAGAWAALERAAATGEAVVVLATSFALVMLLEDARVRTLPALRLAEGSRIVDTGGYKGRTRELDRRELLELIRQRLGVEPAWCENEYGMSELSSQAWLGTVATALGRRCADPQSPRWMPAWMRIEVVDPATLDAVADGEQGLLVVHDLANGWSCGAVRTEDLAIRRGASFELVGRAPGAQLKGCSLRLEDIQ